MFRSLQILILVVMIALSAVGVSAQRRSKPGRVCGDPTAVCKHSESFQPFDMAFDYGTNNVISESDWFYGIVLKSKKMKGFGDCSKPVFTEAERLSIQELFPKNKVFSLNCLESVSNYYNGVADRTAFIGVYAGRTLSEANRFLPTVRKANKFPGVRVRRMQVGINGT